MPRTLLILVLTSCLAPPCLANTIYVDGSCSSQGNGSTPGNCTGAAGTCKCSRSGPKKTVEAGVAALRNCTTEPCVLRIRGAATGRAFDGRYKGVAVRSAVYGAPGNPIIYEGYGYTGLNAHTEEAVYLESATDASNACTKAGKPNCWTRCMDCSTGTCAGVSGTCGDVHYYTTTGSTIYFATVNNGASTTPVWNSLSLMTDANSAYRLSKTRLLVRWGPAVPSGTSVAVGRSDVWNVKGECTLAPGKLCDSSSDCTGSGVCEQTGGAYQTWRGLTFRNGARAAINTPVAKSTPAKGITIQNVTMTGFLDAAEGSARPLTVTDAVDLLVEWSEFSNSSNEPLHMDGHAVAAKTADIRYNWIHDIGNPKLMGNALGGTPNCTTFGDQEYRGVADYSGFKFYGNLIDGCFKSVLGNSGSKALLFEAMSNGIWAYDNVIRRAGSCFKWATEGYATGGAKVFNNICIEPGSGSNGGDAVAFLFAAEGGSITRNAIYNNTVVTSTGAAVQCNETTGISDNQLRNNIFVDTRGSGFDLLVDCQATGNKLENTLIKYLNPSAPASTPLVRFGGATTFTCAQFAGGSVGPNNLCVDPMLVSPEAYDVRLRPGSPAINAGTQAGRPGARAGIVNPLAASHGFPDYSKTPPEGTTPDIGAWESPPQKEGN